MGKFSKELHEKVGEETYKNKIDILICSGNNAKYIAQKAKENMKQENVYYLEKIEEVRKLLPKIMKSGDVILFKASNRMKFYELAEELIKNDT